MRPDPVPTMLASGSILLAAMLVAMVVEAGSLASLLTVRGLRTDNPLVVMASVLIQLLLGVVGLVMTLTFPVLSLYYGMAELRKSFRGVLSSLPIFALGSIPMLAYFVSATRIESRVILAAGLAGAAIVTARHFWLHRDPDAR